MQAAAGEGGAEGAEEGFGGMALKSRSRPDLQPAVHARTQVRLPTCLQGNIAVPAIHECHGPALAAGRSCGLHLSLLQVRSPTTSHGALSPALYSSSGCCMQHACTIAHGWHATSSCSCFPCVHSSMLNMADACRGWSRPLGATACQQTTASSSNTCSTRCLNPNPEP